MKCQSMRVHGLWCEASPSIAVPCVDLCELTLFLQHVDLHVDDSVTYLKILGCSGTPR